MIIWLCGQPGSGKTTLARYLKQAFKEQLIERINTGINYRKHPDLIQIIDGDGLRTIFNNQDYTATGRDKNLTDAITVARWLHSQGFLVIMALVAPYVRHRNALHITHGDDFFEVYLHTDERRGREHYHVENFELPNNKSALKLDTGEKSADICTYEILLHILKRQEEVANKFWQDQEVKRIKKILRIEDQERQIDDAIDDLKTL